MAHTWHIVSPGGAGIAAFAAAEIAAMFSRYLADPVPCGRTAVCGKNNLIFGTAAFQPAAEALEKLCLPLPAEPEQFVIRAGTGLLEPGYDAAVICGADARGMLYGVEEFIRQYADQLPVSFGGDYRSTVFHPFADPCPPFSAEGKPGVAKRGLWTWGHVVYDYRAFLDNMARQKLNTLIVWNNFAPVNGREIVRYAHDRGVELLWGFTWGWGEAMDFSDPASRNDWKARVLAEYETAYAPLGGDGIYFQTATEFAESGEPEEIRAFAASVVDWVNDIAGALLEKAPALRIEFGLHASSVRSALDVLAQTDPRVAIIWEDCGDFPFDYHAAADRDRAGTDACAARMLALRGPSEQAGFVLKGVSTLFWPTFRKQTGPFVMGEASEERIQTRLREIRPLIRQEQAAWLARVPQLAETAKSLAACRGSVTLLCEDGCYERAQWLPTALFAEALWSPDTAPEQLLYRASVCRETVFA